MKKNSILILLFMLLTTTHITAENETWEFYFAMKEPSKEELAAANGHSLGNEVSFLYESFMSMYVTKEEVVPGDPARRTVIHKPSIYHAVRNVDKHIKKSIKKENLAEKVAAKKLLKVLRTAIAAIDSESDSFEDALKQSKKKPAQQLVLFEQALLKELSLKSATQYFFFKYSF